MRNGNFAVSDFNLRAYMIARFLGIVVAGLAACSARGLAGEVGAVDANSLVRLEDYLGYAAEHNAGLKSSFQEWQAAVEEIPQAQALPDPELNYGYLARQSDMQMSQTVSVMQMFPWFGKIDARTEAAMKGAEAAHQKYQAARLALFKEVKEAFHEFAYLGSAVEIGEQNLELLRHFEEVARTKYTAAEAGQPDVIRAQVELAKMEYVLRSLEAMRKPAVSKLARALSLPQDVELAWPEVGEFEAGEIEYERLADALRRNNPELAGLEFEAMAAKSRIELARKNFYPDMGVGVEWAQFDKSSAAMGANSGRDAVTLMFRINLPLRRESYSAGERQARAMAASVGQEKIEMENSLLAKAAQSYYEYNDSVRRIRLYRDSLIPKAEELVGASETAYKAGTLDFLSLIDSQRLLLDYYLSHRRALTDNRQKLAELEMLAGVELN